jgi:hypothetical protein
MRSSFWSGNAKDQLRTQAEVGGACPKIIFNDANSGAGQQPDNGGGYQGGSANLLARETEIIMGGAHQSSRASSSSKGIFDT